jgi:hypothetical protein
MKRQLAKKQFEVDTLMKQLRKAQKQILIFGFACFAQVIKGFSLVSVLGYTPQGFRPSVGYPGPGPCGLLLTSFPSCSQGPYPAPCLLPDLLLLLQWPFSNRNIVPL